jgi:hypothetical protein
MKNMKKRKFTAVVKYAYLVTVQAKTAEEAADKIERWAFDQYDPPESCNLVSEGALDNPPNSDDVECSCSESCIGVPEPYTNRQALSKMDCRLTHLPSDD